MSDLIKQLKFDKVNVQIVAEASLVKEEALLASKTIETVDDVFEASYAHKALKTCLLYTSPSPRDGLLSRMPSSA